MKTEKEIFIDDVRRSISSQAGATPRPKRKSLTRRLYTKVGVPGVTLMIIAGVTLGVLGGYFFSSLQVTMRSTVTTKGMEVMSVFLWDGTMLTNNKTNVLCDITELTAGEHQVFPHTLKNVDNGLWEITIDMSAMDDIFNDPLNPFFGFSLVVTPDTFQLGPGEEQEMTWNYSLSHEFLDPVVFGYNATDSMPFNVTVNIALFEGVIAEPDTYSLTGETNIIFPMSNDHDYQQTGQQGMHISSVTQAGGSTLIEILPGAQSLSVYSQSPSSFEFTYMATTNTTGLSDTVTITYVRTS